MLFQDRPDLEIVIAPPGRVRQGLFRGQAGAGLVLAQDVAQRQYLGRGRDRIGIQVVELLGISQYRRKLVG
jgi:hypothetical protein